jgi:nuclear pore complex protein Nup98-Nup96
MSGFGGFGGFGQNNNNNQQSSGFGSGFGQASNTTSGKSGFLSYPTGRGTGEQKDENEGRLGICTNFWLTPPSLLRTGFGSTTNNTGFGSTANTGGSLFGGTSGGFGSSGGTSRLLQRSGIS